MLCGRPRYEPTPIVKAPDPEAARASAGGPTIRLPWGTVAQLLFFGETARVRDAAASLLDSVQPKRFDSIECSDADFGSLPLWERVAVRLWAASIEADSTSRRAWESAGGAAVVCDAFGRANRESKRSYRVAWLMGTAMSSDRGRTERSVQNRLVFQLPASPSDLTVRVHQCQRVVPDRACNHALRPARWIIDQDAFKVEVSKCSEIRRAGPWSALQLFAPDGTLREEFRSPPEQFSKAGMVSLDPRLLLRIESGALHGHVLVQSSRARYQRDDRPQTIVHSIEIGASLEDPPVFARIRGDLEARQSLGRGMPLHPLSMPLLDGETMRSLDAIAGVTGVDCGTHIRGSFFYASGKRAALPAPAKPLGSVTSPSTEELGVPAPSAVTSATAVDSPWHSLPSSRIEELEAHVAH